MTGSESLKDAIKSNAVDKKVDSLLNGLVIFRKLRKPLCQFVLEMPDWKCPMLVVINHFSPDLFYSNWRRLDLLTTA